MKTLYQKQKTIKKEGSIRGTGLHTGTSCTVHLKPAPANTGVRFLNKGRSIEPVVPEASERCTSIGNNGQEIKTVEHLLAVLQGLGINNLVVDVHGPELPGLDGSALPFVEYFKTLGIIELTEKLECYQLSEPIFCYENNKALAMYPAEDLRVAYILDYDHPYLQNQKVDFTVTPDLFEKEIAPARTFCTQAEAEKVRQKGLGLGASHENTLLISDEGVVGNRLRFADECARHKVLDILGDLNLLGFPVTGRVIGLRSGHSLNRKLVTAIKQQRGL